MNIMKFTLNTCSFCYKGPTSNANQQKKPIPWRNLTKISFPNPYDKNPNQEHKTLQNIIQGSKIMKRIYKYLRNVNGMKDHSNWLGFDVKYWKRGFREDGRGLKQVSHKKPFKKLFLGDSRLGKSRGSVAKIFTSREWVASKPRVASFSRENFRESRVSREQAASESPKASGWARDWGFATGESPAEPRKNSDTCFSIQNMFKQWKTK